MSLQPFYIEDGLLLSYDFWLDTSKDAILNTLNLRVVAWNNTDDTYFVLNNYEIPIIATIVSGIQNISLDQTRLFPLHINDQFNFVQITTDLLVGTKQHYTLLIALKISWQDWIAQIDADTVFFNASKPLGNLNKKASNYSEINDYSIKFSLLANLDGTNDIGETGTTDYNMITPAIIVSDYDASTDWTSTIQTFDAVTLVDLGGAISQTNNTIVKGTHVNSGGAITDITDYWAIHRIEKTGQLGYAIQELSTIHPYPATNILIPLSTETRLKKYLDTGDVITECLIDVTKLEAGVQYNLSCRISDGAGGAVVPTDAKFLEDGTFKILEDGTIKVIE